MEEMEIEAMNDRCQTGRHQICGSHIGYEGSLKIIVMTTITLKFMLGSLPSLWDRSSQTFGMQVFHQAHDDEIRALRYLVNLLPIKQLFRPMLCLQWLGPYTLFYRTRAIGSTILSIKMSLLYKFEFEIWTILSILIFHDLWEVVIVI